MDYYLLTFSNTHAAMAAQKYLEGQISFYVCPTLRELSASCGISLRINNSDYDEIEDIMKDYPLGREMYQLYFITKTDIIAMNEKRGYYTSGE